MRSDAGRSKRRRMRDAFEVIPVVEIRLRGTGAAAEIAGLAGRVPQRGQHPSLIHIAPVMLRQIESIPTGKSAAIARPTSYQGGRFQFLQPGPHQAVTLRHLPGFARMVVVDFIRALPCDAALQNLAWMFEIVVRLGINPRPHFLLGAPLEDDVVFLRSAAGSSLVSRSEEHTSELQSL